MLNASAKSTAPMSQSLVFTGYKIIQDIVDATLVKNAELKILLREASGIEMSQRKLSLIDDQEGVPVSDISIRFFGIEWPSVLRRWNILERKTRSVFYFTR